MTPAMAQVTTAATLRIPVGKVVSSANFRTAPIADISSVFVPRHFTAAAAEPDADSCPVILPR